MVVNVAELMSSRLASETFAAAVAVGSASEAAQVRPFLVGGSVRDVLVGRAGIVDLDIALVAANSETFERVAALTGGTVTRRSQFVTAKLRIGELEVDLAMARAEEYPYPASLPVVREGTLKDDLARRDFSVNAMAVSLHSDSWGNLVDLHCGLVDLEQGRLRVLHGDSFRDDPTRILRAARYSARLALLPTQETIDALLNAVDYLDELSPARLRNELERVFLESDPSGALGYLSEWGMLRAVHPSLTFRRGAWTRFASVAADLSHEEKIYVGYAILGFGLSDVDANGLIGRLKPNTPSRRSVQESASLGRLLAGNLSGCTNSQVAQMLDPLAKTSVLGASLAGGGETGCRLNEYLRNHRDLRPRLTGDDLISLGVPGGQAVGRVLDVLRNAWLDGDVTSPEAELALAEKLIARLAEN